MFSKAKAPVKPLFISEEVLFVFDFVFSAMVNQGSKRELYIVVLNEVRLTMKVLSLIVLLIIFIPANTLSMGLAPVPRDEPGETVKTTATPSSGKPFQTSFFSLTRGHAIAPSFLTFGDGEQFEISTPGEDFLKATGTFTKDNLLFNARFEATLLKQEKHYQYTFTLKGISLLDNYIAGVLVLSEFIQETDQTQEVRFLFLGTPETDEAPEEEKKGLFPF